MNKEILDELIKVAKQLDAVGLYKEASSVDKIAQNGLSVFASVNPVGFTSNNPNKKVQTPSSYSVTGQYSDRIQRYKDLVQKNDVQGATNYFNAVMRSSFTPEQKGAFRAQAERIRMISNHGEYANDAMNTVEENYDLHNFLMNNRLLDTNINKIEFDRRWTKMMTNIMYTRDQFGVLNKDNPAWNKQMNLTYNMLTQKFKR